MYPAHTINGVPLTDPGGRWHEGQGTEVFAGFPGARTSTYELPGVGGALSSQAAPTAATTIGLQVIINAVDDKGKIVSGRPARMAAIGKHLDAFMLATGLGLFQGPRGAIKVVRAYSATESREAICSPSASFKPEHTPGSDHATVMLVLTNLDGLWRDAAYVQSNPIYSGQSQTVHTLNGSSAPIQDALLGIIGPATNPRVLNEQGEGFQLMLNVPAGKSVVVNSRLWSYGEIATGAPRYADPHLLRAALRPVGHTTGRALTIVPRPGGGTVSFLAGDATASTHLIVNARKAYY